MHSRHYAARRQTRAPPPPLPRSLTRLRRASHGGGKRPMTKQLPLSANDCALWRDMCAGKREPGDALDANCRIFSVPPLHHTSLQPSEAIRVEQEEVVDRTARPGTSRILILWQSHRDGGTRADTALIGGCELTERDGAYLCAHEPEPHSGMRRFGNTAVRLYT